MREKHVEDALGRLLRAGDPAAPASGLEPAQSSAMRRRMLAAHRERRERPNGWLVPATAVVGLLALALGLAWQAPHSPPPRNAELPSAATATAPSDDDGRQVQFTTENGTLVVWVLMRRTTG